MNSKTVSRKLCVAFISLLICLNISACDSGAPEQAALEPVEPTEPIDDRPNILLIVADDLGYSDLGAYGGEIETPNLDRLARSGVRMTNFHVAPTCSPTRAMLMSGTDTHLAGLGIMAEMSVDASPEQKASDAYKGYLSLDVESFPAKLKEAGYHTYMAGKWHLANLKGGDSGSDDWLAAVRQTSAAARGFEESFILLQGGASHFGDKMGPMPVQPEALYMDGMDMVQQLPEDFYSSAYYTDRLIESIEANRKDGKPFFAYAAYTAPHWPLQLPLEAMDGPKGEPFWRDRFAAYESLYAEGYDSIRNTRLARMKMAGVVPRDTEPNPWTGMTPAWTGLSADDRRRAVREMAVYATMVEYMDYQIGRLLGHVDDSTLVVFMSDNGAEATNPFEFWGNFPKPAVEAFTARLDLAYENMGKPGSYVSYRKGWTRVSATPYRLYKGTTAEGGIRAPLIVRYPGSAHAGAISNAFCTVLDLAPTFLDIARAKQPIQPLRGGSLVPFLESGAAVHDADDGVGWELLGGRAFIQNNFKLFMLAPGDFHGDGTWELFDLSRDPGETRDLKNDSGYTGIFSFLMEEYNRYADECGVIEYGPEDVPHP